MKFTITDSAGNQYVLETDKSHGQLLIEFPPTTDIIPVVPKAPTPPVAENVEAVVKKPKAKKAETN